MTAILLIAILIMGFLLSDARTRLSRIERDLADRLAGERFAHLNDLHAAPLPPEDKIEPYRGPARTITKAGPVLNVEDMMPKQPIDEMAETMAIETDELVRVETSSPEHDESFAPLNEKPVDNAPSRTKGFEDLFGRRLPIWAGGVTLLVAAVLLVKYSIDAGMLSPSVRIILGLIFGMGLIAGAEVTKRLERFVQDDRVAQSLAGAGIGALFAATLAANNLYGLISAGTAFAGLTATTALAMGLALRFGAPCAVLALVGGLATPALVHSGAPNVPLLSGYLAMVIGSLTLLSHRQRWFWLGVMALVGGMSWTALIIVMTTLNQLSILSVGMLIMLLGLALPFFSSNDARGAMTQIVGAVAAALQLALLVSFGGYAPLSWGLYGLLSLAFIWLSQRMPALRPFIPLPFAAGLALMAIWPNPATGLFAAVMGGHMALFGGSALWRLWRDQGAVRDVTQASIGPIAGYFVTIEQVGLTDRVDDNLLALIGLIFAAIPILGVILGWQRAERHEDRRFPILALASGFLLMMAGLIGLPEWTAPLTIATIAVLLLWIARLSHDQRISNGALIYLAGAIITLAATSALSNELLRLRENAPLTQPFQAMMRWGGTALVCGLFAWRHIGGTRGAVLTAITAIMTYGFVAQMLPALWLPLIMATFMLTLALVTQRKAFALFDPAMMVFTAICALWMIEPIAHWLFIAAFSLVGNPVLVSNLPSTLSVLRQLIGPVLLIAAAAWLLTGKFKSLPNWAIPSVLAVPMLIGTHCLYKLIFAIRDQNQFITLGLAERTIWEIALAAAGLGLWRFARQRELALTLIGAGLIHNIFYTIGLHNPLWASQSVGPWPLVNLLLPAFGLAFAGRRLINIVIPDFDHGHRRITDGIQMILLLFFAFTSLRHAFNGSLFADKPIGETESIFWSALAIAMAISWLLWGIRRAQHSWRIGSLVLMLTAIAKVFLIDASGLEGLLRVASFLALGFSLIVIGWLYSRFLRRDAL